MDIIIIGGGASGLVAGIVAARAGKKVMILEHKDKIGKKILATGNGKCNYTNRNQNPDFYRGENLDFATKAFSQFGLEKTLEFFQRLGIYPKEKNGYYYPNSEQAASVLDVLKMELEYLKVKIVCNEHVEKIEKKQVFEVKTKKQRYKSKKVLLATGGMSSSDLGSDGSGYKIAEDFGHTIITPVPALVALKGDAQYFKTVSGVRTDALIMLYIDGKKTIQSSGELQLTNYGVSGIPIFEISRFAAKALDMKKNVSITIDFMKNIKKEEVYFILKERIHNCPYKTIEEIFNGWLNKKLSYMLIKEASIPLLTKGDNITEKEIKRLVNQIKEFKVSITDTNSFSNAQVSAGGVNTMEVDAFTMESKIIKGLYFMGELLDVDGTCGGYNLQWAWSSGYIAGLHSSID